MNAGRNLVARRVAGLAVALALSVWAPTLLANPQPITADDDRGPAFDRRPDGFPMVRLTCPETQPYRIFVPPSIRILWEGLPAGHQGHYKIREYKYILLGPGSEFPVELAFAQPDSLRSYYANHPQGPWTGWTSTTPTTTEAELDNLIPGEQYLFAVIAIDRAGRYTQVFSLSSLPSNLLRFDVNFIVYQGPVITMSGPGLNHQYAHGGYCPCPETEVPTSVPAQSQATFHWFADPGFLCQSPAIRSYRWALDIADVTDQTPRIDEETDLAHWSAPSLTATSATLGPFAAGATHRLYIEAEDRAGVRSLGIARIEVGQNAARPLAAGREAPRVVSLSPGAITGSQAELRYSLPSSAEVSIAAYDIGGRRVATIESASRPAGAHHVTWDRSGMRPGVYFYRMQAGSATVVKSFVISN